MDYEKLLTLPDVEYLFKTQRENTPGYPGSFYAHHSNVTTTGYREPSNQKGTGYKIQPRSGRTVYVEPKYIDKLAMFQNPDVGTKFVPVMEDGKPIGRAALVLTEDYGPKKTGSVLAEVPYKTAPAIGLAPLEINRSESPVGQTGGIHFGSPITEVHRKSDLSKSTKAGVAGLLAGGVGAAKAATQGDFGPAREFVGEMLTPLSATPSNLNRGEQEWIDRYGSAAQRRYEQEAKRAIERMQGYAKGGAVPMPSAYSKGNWKLI